MYKFLSIMMLGLVLMGKAFCLSDPGIETDNIGRVLKYPGKIEVACPVQDNKTSVILVIGQSNSANHGSERFTTKFPAQVFNYFDGKCYVAASPLLGSTGIDGEFITPMADQLISNGDYDKVIIVSFGIGGTTINCWERGAVFNNILQPILTKLRSQYVVTDIVWHQGESDFGVHTTKDQYMNSFHSLIDSIRNYPTPLCPLPNVYYAIATKCGDKPDWTPINEISKAQELLASDNYNIFLGANTDELLLEEDRDISHCHFSESGQIKTANSYAAAIHQHQRRS